MENTYNYLKNVLLELKTESSKNPSIIGIVLVLLCIPLLYALNSVSLALLVGITFYTFKKENFKIEKKLVLPIALFGLMALSLLWSINVSDSVKAISKGLPLLLIPLSFMLFSSLTNAQKEKIYQIYSLGIGVYTIFCLVKAIIRYIITQNSNVFFYHELVTEDVNAIHVSVYVSLAIFYFISRGFSSVLNKIAILILTVFLILLSSKNIIIIFFGLLILYFLRYYQSQIKRKTLLIGVLFCILTIAVFSGKIKDRFLIEFQTNIKENTVNQEISTATGKVYNVSVKQAWNQDKFNASYYFPGTAFRVYQIRIFKELLFEDAIFFTGYGLNATDSKIEQKSIEHNLYDGYGKKNFHNEYIQIFAEIGIFGLLLLLTMMFLNLKNAIKKKDFMHISFAVLMISLFLTESFLSRQRGIVFFTIFYCLFNADNLIVASKKE
jgi:O-antigen ligase